MLPFFSALSAAYMLWVFANHIFLVSESDFSTINARILVLGALFCLLQALQKLAGRILQKIRPEQRPTFLKNFRFWLPQLGRFFGNSFGTFFRFLETWLGFWESAWSQSRRRPVAAMLLGIALFLQVRDCAIDYYRVFGKSMEPGLKSGDYVLLAKWKNGCDYRGLSLLWKKERRRPITEDRPQVRHGDRIVFALPTGRIFLKRVIGLPGDSYRFAAGRVWINGTPLQEPYLPRNSYTSAEPPLSLIPAKTLPKDYQKLSDFARYAARFGAGESGRVPAHALLVLGDNRRHSIDSRNFGFVPYNRIVGVVWP